MPIRKPTKPRGTLRKHEEPKLCSQTNPPVYPDPRFKWSYNNDMDMYVPYPLDQPEEKEKKPTKEKRYRGFMITIMNWLEADIKHLEDMYEGDTKCKYLIIGFEEAPRTGTPHLQCYIYYTEAVTKTQMVKRQHRPYTVDPSDAKNPASCYTYCMKGEYYHEMGERPIQGQRTDLAAMYHDIWLNKRTLGDVMKMYPEKYGYFFRSIDRVRDELLRFPTRMITYSTNGNPMAVMEYLYKIYKHSFDEIYMDHQITNLELCKIILSNKYRVIFYPRNENAIDQAFYTHCDGYIAAHISESGMEIYDDSFMENLK